MKRYFDQDYPAGLLDPSQEQQLPGGVTFTLAEPALPTYWLAGSPGEQTVWSLGGRVGFNDSRVGQKISEIVASVGEGGLEIGEIVAILLPLFETFYSAVSEAELADTPDFEEPVEQGNVLSLPMSNQLEITLPSLIQLGEGQWADTMLLLGGALTADERFVPLGITAGSDVDVNFPEPDGVVDGDPTSIAPDNFSLFMAPKHHHIQTEAAQKVVVAVSAVLDGGGDIPEAGSAIIRQLEDIPAGPQPNGSLILLRERRSFFLHFSVQHGTRRVADSSPLPLELKTRMASEESFFEGRTGNSGTYTSPGRSTMWSFPIRRCLRFPRETGLECEVLRGKRLPRSRRHEPLSTGNSGRRFPAQPVDRRGERQLRS